MKKIIITSSLAAILIALTLVVARPMIVHALTTDELQRTASNSLRDINARCSASDIRGMITSIQGALSTEYIKEMLAQFLDPAIIGPYLACLLPGTSFLGTGNTAISCPLSFGGYAEAIAKTTVANKLKADFMANCVARSVMDNAFKKAQRVMNENGRDGGSLAVQDWGDLFANSVDRGIRISRNNKANTRYCPWGPQDFMESRFNFSPKDAVKPTVYADGTQSDIDRNACSLGQNFDVANPSAAGIAEMSMPQNTFWGSYIIGVGQERQQIAHEVLVDTSEVGPTGGLFGIRDQDPVTGTSCVQPDPTNPKKCLKYGPMVQSAAAVQAEVQAERQANWDWVTNARQSGTILGDVQNQLISSLLSSTQQALNVEFALDAGQESIIQDAQAPAQGGPTGSTLACPNIADNCSCLVDNQSAQMLASSTVLQAQQAAITNHPEITDGTSILPTSSNAAFLDVVCYDTTIYAAGTCRPSANGTSVIISLGVVDVQVGIITSGGIIRLPGQVVSACMTGTL